MYKNLNKTEWENVKLHLKTCKHMTGRRKPWLNQKNLKKGTQ